MRLKEHFHCLVPQIVATQVAGQMLHYAMLKKFIATEPLRKVEPNSTYRNGFWPLQGMLHWAMIRATFLVMALRDKFHEKLHSVRFSLPCCVAHSLCYILRKKQHQLVALVLNFSRIVLPCDWII